MIAKGFNKMFQNYLKFKGIWNGCPEGGMNETPKVSFSQNMILTKALVMVVDL